MLVVATGSTLIGTAVISIVAEKAHDRIGNIFQALYDSGIIRSNTSLVIEVRVHKVEE